MYILVLEMFLWERGPGGRFSGFDAEMARATAALAANQGLYNGFLAAGLVWGLIADDPTGYRVQVFFLACVIVAGVYGAATANRRILFAQALPGALALAAVLVAPAERPPEAQDPAPRGPEAACGTPCSDECAGRPLDGRQRLGAGPQRPGSAVPRSICTTTTCRRSPSTPAPRSYGTRWTPCTPGGADPDPAAPPAALSEFFTGPPATPPLPHAAAARRQRPAGRTAPPGAARPSRGASGSGPGHRTPDLVASAVAAAFTGVLADWLHGLIDGEPDAIARRVSSLLLAMHRAWGTA